MKKYLTFLPLPPHPFWYKYERSLNSNSGKMRPWDKSPGFLNKAAVPCPNKSSLSSLACHELSSTSLHSATEELALLLSREDFHFHSFSHSSCI